MLNIPIQAKKSRYVIDGMSVKNQRYALNNTIGKNLIYKINEKTGGARFYKRDVKATEQYHVGEDVARIVHTKHGFELRPGEKPKGDRFLRVFEKRLESKCTEYNKQHKKAA